MGNILSFQGFCENLMFSAGPAASLVVATKYDQKTWIKFERALTAGFGLGLILKPDFMMSGLVRLFFVLLFLLYARFRTKM